VEAARPPTNPSVACFARSDVVWGTITQGCGRLGLTLGYNLASPIFAAFASRPLRFQTRS